MPAPPLRVLVAPDTFTGTLTGAEAAAAIAEGVRQAVPGAVATSVPLADGARGTVDAVLAAGGVGRAVRVPGPTGTPVTARFAMTGGTAVLEASQACGLQLLDPTPRTSLTAHSAGVGELIRAALAAGATQVVLGLDGVACADGGAGMASALGARLLDGRGARLPLGGGALADLASVELELLQEVVARATFVAVTDVTTPLLGPDGAAAVHGPQTGAAPREVEMLERGLARWADLVEEAFGVRTRDRPGAGAAGGLGWGMATLLGARVRPREEVAMELLGVDEALAQADLVITGKGRLDRQSTVGEGPVALARAAHERGIPVLDVTLEDGVADPAEALRSTTASAVLSLLGWARPQRSPLCCDA